MTMAKLLLTTGGLLCYVSLFYVAHGFKATCFKSCGNLDLKNNTSEHIMLATNARDEPRIIEWAAHHLNIGFDYILIIDHSSVVPLSDTFKMFDKRVEVCSVTSKSASHITGNVKGFAMHVAVTTALKMNFDWLMYLDADEYLILNCCATVHEFVDKWKRADQLSLNWLIFGSNGLIHEPSDVVIASYNRSATKFCREVKSIARVRAISFPIVSAHYFALSHGLTVGMNNKTVDKSAPYYHVMRSRFNFSVVDAYVAHFQIQSKETYFSRKLNRTRDDGGGHWPGLDFNADNDVENMFPSLKYAMLIRERLERHENGTGECSVRRLHVR